MTAGNVGRKSLDGFARSPPVHLIAVPRLYRFSMAEMGCRLNPCGGPGGNCRTEKKLDSRLPPNSALFCSQCQDDDLEDYEDDWEESDMED